MPVISRQPSQQITRLGLIQVRDDDYKLIKLRATPVA